MQPIMPFLLFLASILSITFATPLTERAKRRIDITVYQDDGCQGTNHRRTKVAYNDPMDASSGYYDNFAPKSYHLSKDLKADENLVFHGENSHGDKFVLTASGKQKSKGCCTLKESFNYFRLEKSNAAPLTKRAASGMDITVYEKRNCHGKPNRRTDVI
ncbi:MAG: hypothetical protein L6R41_005852 [Letrouitia leprolyta]|nr:MAG: hypothetical protein L6R41_005852 [Letrouitia leprolyta]